MSMSISPLENFLITSVSYFRLCAVSLSRRAIFALGFLYNLYMSTQSLPVNDQVFIAQSEVIRRVAAEGPCIIVGRCADYVLRNQSGVDALNLFIHAPMEERIRRVREEYKVQAPDLRLYILKQDKNRAAYYEHFTDGQWGKAQNYHLAVSSGLGLETIVRLLTDLMRDRGLGA